MAKITRFNLELAKTVKKTLELAEKL